MPRSTRMWFVAAVVAAMTSSPGAQQSAAPSKGRAFTAEELATYRAALPDAPARETVIRVCGQCHGNQAVYNHLTEDYHACPICKGAGEVKGDE